MVHRMLQYRIQAAQNVTNIKSKQSRIHKNAIKFVCMLSQKIAYNDFHVLNLFKI
jgi:hypothetical protein